MAMLPIKKLNDPDSGSGNKCYPLSVLEASVITSQVVVGSRVGGYNIGDIIPMCTTLNDIIKKLFSENSNVFVINDWSEAVTTNVPSASLVKNALNTKENSGTAQRLINSFKQESFDPLSDTVDQHTTEIEKIPGIISRLDTIYSNDGSTGVLKNVSTKVDNVESRVNDIYNPTNQTGSLKNLIDRVDAIYSSDGSSGVLKSLSDTVQDNLLSKIKGTKYSDIDTDPDMDKYTASNPVVLKSALEYYVNKRVNEAELRTGAVQLVGVVNDSCDDYNDYSGCETISQVWTIYQQKHSEIYPSTTPQNGYLLLWDDDEYLYSSTDKAWHPYGNLNGVVKSGQITDQDIASGANIAQSKIDGLVTNLASKQDKITAGGGLKFDSTNVNTLMHTNSAVTAQSDSKIYKITHDGYGHITGSTAVAKSDITALGIPAQDTTYTDFVGANGATDGISGLVPAPISTDSTKFLKGDGTWDAPTDTTYNAGTGLSLNGTTINHSNTIDQQTTAVFKKITYDAQGHITGVSDVTKSDITALNIPGQDTTYTAGSGLSLSGTEINHSNSVTAVATSSFKKVTYDSQGHITGSQNVEKSDITNLGIPAQDTTYNEFIGADGSLDGTSGLVTAPLATDNTKFLKGDGTWATPTDTTYSAGTGLSLSGTTINHSNSVTAVTSNSFKKVAYDDQGHITGSSDVTATDITNLGIPAQDTTYSEFTGATASDPGTSGLVTTPLSGDNTKFLKGDGTWATPTDTTYNEFSGADGINPGTSGLVKAPTATDNTKFLKGDGTWATPTDTTYSAGTGLSLSGTTINHSNSVTAVTASSLLKITHDTEGHITASTTIGDNDIVLKPSNIQNLTQQLSYIAGIMNALNSLVFPETYKADLTTDDGIAVAVKAILMKLGVLEANIDI